MNAERLGELIDRHAPALQLYAGQWCDVPEDVVQEAFLKLATLTIEPRDPVAWLFRVVRNGSLTAARSARRRLFHESAAARRASFVEPEDATLDARAVTEALTRIPADQREVIVARLWGGLTFAQIGEVTGTSAASAHRLYAAGLARLRTHWSQPCPPKAT
jgi:RNA polymerase sigma-70 factor (ECF subfamily)